MDDEVKEMVLGPVFEPSGSRLSDGRPICTKIYKRRENDRKEEEKKQKNN